MLCCMTRTDFLDMVDELFFSLLICCTAQGWFSWLPVMAGSCSYRSLLLLLHLVCLITPASGDFAGVTSGSISVQLVLCVCCLSYQCFTAQKSSSSDKDFNHEHEDKAAEYGNSLNSVGKSNTGWLRERTHKRYNRPEIVEEIQVFLSKRIKKK